jgi:AmmeMemoRadiSam system protein B
VHELLESCSTFRIQNEVHHFEHGLEVQLPFLQEAIDNFRIVPLLLGSQNAICEAADALSRIMNDETLLVVSSDLSHYLSQADAEKIDQRTIDAILTRDPERFRKATIGRMRRGTLGLLTCACGASAIEVALHIAQRLHILDSRLLAYQNSAHITKDCQRVVGYASIIFS